MDPDARRFGAAMLAAKERLGIHSLGDYHVEYEEDTSSPVTCVRRAIQRLWRLDPAPSALVCFEQDTAAMARHALQEAGLPCPARVSIVTRQTLTDAVDFTALKCDPERMGATAANHLVARLINPASSAARLLFPSKLVTGSTTAPARSS